LIAAAAQKQMPTQNNVHIPDDLLRKLNVAAQAEGKTANDLVEEAARRMLRTKGLPSFVAESRAHAESLGLSEGDVPRLIDEVSRGR
jgi:plasmid stability protein